MDNYYDHETGDWVTSWSRYQAVAAAFDGIDEHIFRGEPERAWPLLMELLHTVPADTVSYVGCGPLESFIRQHGTAFVEHLVAAAAVDGRFREAVLEVDLARGHLPPETEARLTAAFGERFRLLEPDDSDETTPPACLDDNRATDGGS